MLTGSPEPFFTQMSSSLPTNPDGMQQPSEQVDASQTQRKKGAPEQAPLAVQQPLKSVPSMLQTVQIEPPVPQTKVPS